MSHAHAAPPTAASSLYDEDVYAWSLQQAQLLRAGQLDAVDAKTIAEEILDVGRNEYDKLESALTTLLVHMLKWDYQPARRSRSWINTIAEQRKRTTRQLRQNPSLKARREEAVQDSYEAAQLRASSETGLEPDQFPAECPYTWDAILNRPFERSEADQP